MKAVVLLSGGLDSSTCLALAKSEGYDCYALSFFYDQKHAIELEAAKRIAKTYRVAEHLIYPLSVDIFQGSALTEKTRSVPEFNPSMTEAPSTYVPARNTVFLSIALAWAEVLEADAIFIGVSSVDYSNYVDCRPAFIDAFQTLARCGTQRGVAGRPIEIKAPLQHLTKAETIQLGQRLGLDYGLTSSCYQPDERGRACGQCDSCHFRKSAFQALQLVDPIAYQDQGKSK